MPLPFDMLAVMLFLGWYAESPPDAVPPLRYGALICLAALPLMALLGAAVNFAAVRALRRPGRSRASRRSVAANAELAVRILQAGLFALVLHETAFPWSLAETLGIAGGGATALGDGGLSPGTRMFAVQFFGLLPYVGLFFAGWLPLFTLHRTVSYGTWTRRSFILNKARYNLYMIAAWAPFAFLANLLSDYLIVLPFLFAGAAWVFPAALARLWGCKPLPEDGATAGAAGTAALVRGLEEKTGARFSRIFLWEPGGGVMNAAAVGLARPFRYLFLTPALVRGLTRDELAAVVLHELGHVRHRHLVFYLFTTLAGVNIAVIAGALLPLESSAARFFAGVLLMLFYFRFVFGWLSRNMERQADLFALETSGSARALANALEKLALAAGNIRLAASWHHLGIAERVDFLRRAERTPELVGAHNAGVGMIKVGGYAAAALTIAFIAWELRSEFAPSAANGFAPGAARARAAQMEEAHWRRVGVLMQ